MKSPSDREELKVREREKGLQDWRISLLIGLRLGQRSLARFASDEASFRFAFCEPCGVLYQREKRPNNA